MNDSLHLNYKMQEFVQDKFTSINFQVACFKNLEEIEKKPLMGFNGSPVYDSTIIIQNPKENGNYEHFIVTKYSFMEHITFSNVLEMLEGKLYEREDKCLNDVVEVPSSTTNPYSIRVFKLVWDN